ncbi:MAG: hypothetical protein IPL88_08720 [Rhizobiales bacterium]|nr:hypothetical protein [Hyphomicrobiales bacterium]
MSVLTVYDCGTAFDENSDDIIATTAKNTLGVRGKDWIINPGVGSDLAMKQKNGAPTMSAAAARALEMVALGPAMGALATTPTGQKYIAQGLGVGLDEATKATVGTVLVVKPTVVNFFGWSRGSISSIKSANALSKYAPDIRCNLFLHDPVIGDPALNIPLHANVSTNTIAPNVDELIVIPQMEACDYIFQAHDIFKGPSNRAKATSVLPMPGIHGSSVYLSNPRYVLGYMICKGLAEDFLTRHGTKLKKHLHVQNRRYLEWYSELWLTLVGKAAGYAPETGMLSNRAEATGFENNLVVRVFFNQHHIDVLGSVAPKTTLALLNALMTRLRPHEQLLKDSDVELAAVKPGLPPKTQAWLDHVSLWMRIFGTRRT